MKKGPNLRWSLIQCSGGDEGDRTPDLLTASQALSQLSYAPVRRSTIRELGRRCKDNFGKTFGGGDEDAGRARGRGARDARGGSGPRTARTPADLARGTRPAPFNSVFRAPPVPLSGPIAKLAQAGRFINGPVYYADSRITDLTPTFAKRTGDLPAVLRAANSVCSATLNPT